MSHHSKTISIDSEDRWAPAILRMAAGFPIAQIFANVSFLEFAESLLPVKVVASSAKNQMARKICNLWLKASQLIFT